MSLQRQSDFDFEWIIVDDGSSDDTEMLVSGFHDDRFPILYHKKENGGKHTALNASHPLVHGQYVLILDSDDFLTPDAVAAVEKHWSQWADHPEVGILTFLKGRDEQSPFCIVKDWNMPVDVTAYPRQLIISNDCAEVLRTELFLKYPFPVFKGERFLAETALWARVGFEKKAVYIDQIIYIADYSEGGLTRSGRTMFNRNPLGGMYNSNLLMDRKHPLKLRIKKGLLFTSYGFFAGLKPKEMAARCDHKLLMYLCLPFGCMLFLHWRRKYIKG